MYESMLYPIVGGIVLFALMQIAVKSKGRALAGKFKKLGNLPGKHLNDIVAAVGPWSAQSALPGGKVLYQWMAPGYHVSIRFQDSLAEGITHESSSL